MKGNDDILKPIRLSISIITLTFIKVIITLVLFFSVILGILRFLEWVF